MQRRVLAAALGAALLGGCGTTVPTAGMAAGSDPGLGAAVTGSSPASPSGAAPAAASSAAASALASGRSATATPASPSRTVGPAGQLPLPSGAGAESGRGFTRSTVQIGIADSDVGSFANTLGAKGISTGDERAQVGAVVSDINRRGGLLGRKIELVWYMVSTTQALNNPSAVDEAACAAWTEDHHVFAVVGPIGTTIDKDLLACLAKTDTPVIGAANPWGLDAQPYFQDLYKAFPTLVNVDSMLGETLYGIAISRLVARGFFSPWDTSTGGPATGAVKPPVKIGVVIHDNPTGELVLAAMTRQLARYGLNVTDVARLSPNLTQSSADGQNAVLRFHTDGITHELGYASMAFAEGQHYRPRYFVPNEPNVIAQNAPAAQLNGAMSESYIPALDVGEDPGPPTPATTTCLRTMERAGQTPSSGTETYVMEAVCDGFFSLHAAITAGGALSTSALIAGFDSLGTRLASAMTWKTTVGPRQHATAGALRDAGYKASCTCFVYVSRTNYS